MTAKSYCEPGCRNYQCQTGDVHVYSCDENNWVIHVNHSRVTYPEPTPAVPSLDLGDPGYIRALGEYQRTVFDLSRRGTSERIGGPHDGEVLHSPSIPVCVAVLDGLRGDGYLVPESVTVALREDEGKAA